MLEDNTNFGSQSLPQDAPGKSLEDAITALEQQFARLTLQGPDDVPSALTTDIRSPLQRADPRSAS